jgi:hypothetical protein
MFTFSSEPTSSSRLCCSLKEVISKCQRIGLHVVATICDQGSANVAAINTLKRDTIQECVAQETQHKYFGFVIDEEEDIPLYDVPHLIEGMRNNFLQKTLCFALDRGLQKIAKWNHIIQFYYLDVADNVRICPKLTDAHVLAHKYNKMKVATCTQTSSHQVGSLMI